MVARKKEEYESLHASTYSLIAETKEKLENPMVWLVVDEAHEFLPNEGKTTASDSLITILREGRQPGISLILASQQPGKIHTDVMTQSDIVIAHRVTAKIDVEALGTLMQSYMREGLDKQLNNLPGLSGSAIVFDDVNERLYPIRVRPRMTWHGGSAPSAMKGEIKKDIFSKF
jgi:DNA helicase HerA-like ATPase